MCHLSGSSLAQEMAWAVSPFHYLTHPTPPGAVYMRQWTGSALVQIMACRLLGTNPLSKPMLGYCQLDPQEQTSVKFQSKYKKWRHQAITWTNVGLSSIRPSDIHLRSVSQEIPHPSVIEISLKIFCLKFHSNFPGANELNHMYQVRTTGGS